MHFNPLELHLPCVLAHCDSYTYLQSMPFCAMAFCNDSFSSEKELFFLVYCCYALVISGIAIFLLLAERLQFIFFL